MEEQGKLEVKNRIQKANITVLPLVESMVPYLQTLYAQKKFFLITLSAIAIISAAILWLIVPTQYEGKVVILPSESSSSVSSTLGSLSGLASAAGINIGTSSPTAIYEKLIYTEAVLEPVIYAKYPAEQSKDSVNLLEYLGYKINPEYPLEKEKRKIFIDLFTLLTEYNRITTEIDASTGILTITVTMTNPKISLMMANNIVFSLDKFVRTKRKSSASNTRKYLESRTSTVKDSLKQAEDILKTFREQNRAIVTPERLLEQNRLVRNVDILNSLYMILVNQLETAKLNEIKDVPVIDYVQLAGDPVYGSGPHRFIFMLVIIFLASVVLCVYIIFKNDLKRYFRLIRNKEV